MIFCPTKFRHQHDIVNIISILYYEIIMNEEPTTNKEILSLNWVHNPALLGFKKWEMTFDWLVFSHVAKLNTEQYMIKCSEK